MTKTTTVSFSSKVNEMLRRTSNFVKIILVKVWILSNEHKAR